MWSSRVTQTGMCVCLISPGWLGSGSSSSFFLTDRSSGPSWSAMRSLLRTGFCAEAAAVPPPPDPLLVPVPLLLWMHVGAEAAAAAAEFGLKPGPGVGEGEEEEEEAEDGGEPGATRGAALGRSFMVPLGGGGEAS